MSMTFKYGASFPRRPSVPKVVPVIALPEESGRRETDITVRGSAARSTSISCRAANPWRKLQSRPEVDWLSWMSMASFPFPAAIVAGPIQEIPLVLGAGPACTRTHPRKMRRASGWIPPISIPCFVA